MRAFGLDPSGFYYMGARYYDPNAGRFVSPDPLGHAASIDLYSAFGGDAVNNFDPDGMCIESTLNLVTRTLGGIGQLGAGGYDLVAQTAWAAGGSGGEYQGVSQLYQNIYDNPSSGPTRGQIIGGTANAELNIATLGLYGMAQGYYNGVTTGNYNQAQDASLNAIFLSGGARAMQSQGINPYGMGYSDVTAPPVLAQPGQVNYGALDSLGRPTGVNATLTDDMLGTGTRPDQSIIPPGFQGGAAGQARGHLLGAQLGGSGDLPENLVTLQQNPANSPVMRGFENQTAAAVRSGQTVNYSSVPIYQGANQIPRGITITGSGSGGFQLGVTVLNPIY